MWHHESGMSMRNRMRTVNTKQKKKNGRSTPDHTPLLHLNSLPSCSLTVANWTKMDTLPVFWVASVSRPVTALHHGEKRTLIKKLHSRLRGSNTKSCQNYTQQEICLTSPPVHCFHLSTSIPTNSHSTHQHSVESEGRHVLNKTER